MTAQKTDTPDIYRQHRRKQIAELTEWTPGFDMTGVDVLGADMLAGSPKAGDMIARNPHDHADKWLVSADYFAGIFEPVELAKPAAPPSGMLRAAEICQEQANVAYGLAERDELPDEVHMALSSVASAIRAEAAKGADK